MHFRGSNDEEGGKEKRNKMPSEPKLQNSHGKVSTCIDHRMMLNNKENIKSRLVSFYLLNAPK